MSDDDKYTLKDEPLLKKLFLFFVSVLVLSGILIFALPDSLMFFKENFENVLLGVVLIISLLTMISMLDLKFPDNGNGYVSVRKIVTIEGYNNSYKLI